MRNVCKCIDCQNAPESECELGILQLSSSTPRRARRCKWWNYLWLHLLFLDMVVYLLIDSVLESRVVGAHSRVLGCISYFEVNTMQTCTSWHTLKSYQSSEYRQHCNTIYMYRASIQYVGIGYWPSALFESLTTHSHLHLSEI